MNWIDWIYLGIGIGLGVGGYWLVGRRESETPVSTTELKLQQELQQLQLACSMAQEMSQFKAGFLARTTHELRSPLNGLIGLHQLILSDLCENPAEEREFVAHAHERSMKLLGLIDEILNVSRVEHGTNKLEIQPLQLSHALAEVSDITRMLAANRNFPVLITELDPEIYVLADPRWFRQVLLNVVDLALHHIESGSIRISTEPELVNSKIYIWIDVPSYTIVFDEPIDLMTQKTETKAEILPSQGVKLWLNQTLLEHMQGKLEIVNLPLTEELDEHYTRVQISIPLLSAEY
jgi:signal transduction histidine kinase